MVWKVIIKKKYKVGSIKYKLKNTTMFSR